MTPVHTFWLLDVLDILIVAALFYRLLSLVKGTRSAQMIVGLLVIALIGLVANYFDLLAVKWIVSSLKTVPRSYAPPSRVVPYRFPASSCARLAWG